MKAHARVVAEGGRERSRCTTLQSAPPLTFRVTSDGLHLVGTAAGPVGGDELMLELTVAAGASLTVRSVAAQMALPSPVPAVSTMHMAIELGPGAELRWLPEPTLLVQGSDHRTTTVVALSPDADLVWREEVVLGRHNEPGGSLLQRLRVERAGSPLLCTELALGPRWPTSAGPAATGGCRVVATTLLVGEPARVAIAGLGAAGSAPTGARAAAYPLTGDAVMLSALADGLDAARSALRDLTDGPGTRAAAMHRVMSRS